MVARLNTKPVSIGTTGELKGRQMARALLGYVGNNNEQTLALEVARLRRRVSELETELAELRHTNHADLDRELHRFAAAAEPVLA